MSLTVVDVLHNNHKLDASGGRGFSQVCFSEESSASVQNCFHELKDFIVDKPFRLSSRELKILKKLERETLEGIAGVKSILEKMLEEDKDIALTNYCKYRALYKKLEVLERREEDYSYRIGRLESTQGMTTQQQTELYKKLLLDLGFEQTVNYETYNRCVETFASEEWPCKIVKKIKSMCNKEKKNQDKLIKRINNKYGIKEQEKVM